MTRMLVLALALAGCIRDHYECSSDGDCNLGVGGRCELDHHCTQLDPTCETGRRFSPHASDESSACFVGTATPLDVCAPGQPPAIADGCAATVCSALPSCCTTGWSEPCVQQAQRVCATTCDTRIAITASKTGHTELWDVTYDGTRWQATAHPELSQVVAYAAPAPGSATPRLAGFSAADTLAFDDGTTLAVDPSHHYQDLASVDFDRDLRDTLALAWVDDAIPVNNFAEVLKVGDGSARELAIPGTTRLSWGDYDQDSYPDGVVGSGGRYILLANVEDAEHHRSLVGNVSGAYSGNGTPGAPATRELSWVDLDGDGKLDLVAFGTSLHPHLGASGSITDQALLNIDCAPPLVNPSATACDMAATAIAGAARPIDSGAELIASTTSVRGIYRVHVHPSAPATSTITPLAITGDVCGATCEPILAVVVRDLDGDHVLDIVAIDAALHLFVALSTVDPTLSTLVENKPIATTTTNFGAVRVSVSGAPR